MVIAQLGFLPPGGAVENHDPIVRSNTDLLHAVTVQVINDVDD